MEFRPCIDIHNGKVKQIVGSSLKDEGNYADENFVSEKDGAYYARLYRDLGIKGGHVILLNKAGTEYYEATRQQAIGALEAFPGGLQIGGGITPDTAPAFIAAGASHVIVTSYVFSDGRINYDNIKKMAEAVGSDRLVLDLSCRKRGNEYFVVTDRWQKFTDEVVSLELLQRLSEFCDEFLIHAVDVEGKASGIEEELVTLLSDYDGNALTYAGGIGSLEVLQSLKEKGKGRINATIGSALDLFGGHIKLEDVIKCIQ